ncbi:MAG TPA: hypothetical protein VMS01_04105 [Stellaceae bacterium]|nr:hypothetical protein [Stellaceae bacterium]
MKYVLVAALAAALSGCSPSGAVPLPPAAPEPPEARAPLPPHHAGRAEINRLVDRLLRRLTEMRDQEVRHDATESVAAPPAPPAGP